MMVIPLSAKECYYAIMIELALPAGNLETAIAAYRNGADAVYFGMKEFSARKGAVNFSEEDLSKIRRFSLENNKKIYVTVNTLVKDENLDKLNNLLAMIAYYGCDGVIVQDFGAIKLMKESYPTLPLHASTQLAVHTTGGVKALQDMGFERVVLSRELSLKEIEKIRRDCPDIELKAFIHGALCYGFSGLCMASFLKCGRSANGGECAQICRTWFTEKASGMNGYFFSMEDLAAGETLTRLNEMGIDSAKIEGRLKGTEYVTALARYYKGILDGNAKREDNDKIKTTFSRKSGQGYFYYKPDRPSLLNTTYPSHMGLPCGRVVEQNRSEIIIKADKPIYPHDGLQYLVKDDRGLEKAVKFSAEITYKDRNYIYLKHKSYEDIDGLEVYKISDASQNEKKTNTNLPLYRKEVDITLDINSDGLTVKALNTVFTYSLEIQEAKKPQDVEETLENLFRESGESKYTLGKLTVNNTSGTTSPFLPLSRLKDMRRSFYAELNKESINILKSLPLTGSKKDYLELPRRSTFSKDLPWSTEETKWNGYTVFTFPPITFNEEKTFKAMEEAAKGKENVLIGINNIGQLCFAKAHPEYQYFADIYLYLSNKYAAELLKPYIIAGYRYMEFKDNDEDWCIKPTESDYTPPLFLSRTCFRHDAMGYPCSGCSQHEDFEIEQNEDTYTVKVRNCLTIVEKKNL